jgi:hypothetical protein
LWWGLCVGNGVSRLPHHLSTMMEEEVGTLRFAHPTQLSQLREFS